MTTDPEDVTADAPDNWDVEVDARCALFEAAPPLSTR